MSIAAANHLRPKLSCHSSPFSPLSSRHLQKRHQLLGHRHKSTKNDASSSQDEESPPSLSPSTPTTRSDVEQPPRQSPPREATAPRRQADSTDWISSQLTRRFGIAGGLAWVGFLLFGVVSEQVKTRIELAEAEANTKDIIAEEIVTPEGLRYLDSRIGGGAPPQKGYLIVLDYKAYANGEVFEDTKARGKPIVFLYKSRPFTGGLCAGVEIALSSMRAGGRRRVTIPPALGFGDAGTTLRPTEHVPGKEGSVPPGAELVYELDLQRVSIPPS